MNKKQNIYTFIGVLAALLIAFGGWYLTDMFISCYGNRQMASTGRIEIAMPDAPAEEVVQLSVSEMSSILSSWQSEIMPRLHEPTAGQLSIEQAILIAREGVAWLDNRDLLPWTFPETTPVNAFLAQNISEDVDFLDAVYSYWLVAFDSGDLIVTMQINAVTGQIWLMEIELVATASPAGWPRQALGYYDNEDGLIDDKLLSDFAAELGLFSLSNHLAERTSFYHGIRYSKAITDSDLHTFILLSGRPLDIDGDEWFIVGLQLGLMIDWQESEESDEELFYN